MTKISISVLLIAWGICAQTHPGEWTGLASMLEPRQEFPVAHVNGKLYAGGGMNSSSCCNAMVNFDEYDIAANSWRKRKDLPVAVNHPVICALNGKIYLMSGYTGGGVFDQGVTNRCFVYDPALNTWTEIAALDKPAAGAGVVVYNERIYLFGGDPTNGFDSNPRSTVMEYNPATNTWRLVNDKMPHARTHIGAGLLGTKVYLSPGRNRQGGNEDDVVQEFDFEKMDQGENAWRVMNPLPSDKRTGYMSNWPQVNGKFYYIGGESPMYKTVHEFTPDANGGTWRRTTDYPTTIHGIGPVAVGNKIYVCGGAAGTGVGGRTDAVYVYTIDSGTTGVHPKTNEQRSKDNSPLKSSLKNPEQLSRMSKVYSVQGRRMSGRTEADGVRILNTAEGKSLRIMRSMK